MNPPSENKARSGRSAGAVALVQGIVGLVAVLIVWLAWDFLQEDGAARDEAARRQVAVTADLAVSEIRTALTGAADALQLLSRLPELRGMHRFGPASELAERANSALLTTISDLAYSTNAARPAPAEPDRLREFVSLWKAAAPVFEYHLAAVRRVAYEVGLLGVLETLPIPETFEPPAVPTGRNAVGTPSWADVAAFFTACLEPALITTGRFLDLALGWGGIILPDPQESGRLLAATLNDRDLIRSVSIRGLDGKELTGVSEIGGITAFGGGWWRRGLRGNRPFYAGPALFDESLGRPLWMAGAPLRDAAREPAGLLTARVDLGFLGDLADTARLTPGSMLIVTDEEGVVIGHHRPSVVVSQVNLRHTNPLVAAALEGEAGEQEIRLTGISYVAAWRSLRGNERHRLPGWAVVCLVPVSELAPGSFRTVLLTVLLASLALGALFYLSGLIETAFEEDAEA
ncbi:MAG TPA: cache domain-containing protein [Candidatus Ozemobacteraceae bacterium]|nr:cache domain-containing protein [Candidatus Ozemobacteraceae bacterium]